MLGSLKKQLLKFMVKDSYAVYAVIDGYWEKMMTRYQKKIIDNSARYIGDSVKGVFGFIGDVIKKNLWIVILLFALNYAIDHKINLGFLSKVTTDDSTRLKVEEGEVASAVIYMDDNIIVIQKKGEDPKQYVGVKKAKLTKFDDGEIDLRVKNKGFGLEPGFTVTAGDGLRLGMDVEYAYWKRFGLTAGFTTPVRGRSLDKVRGHLGLSYDIPNRWFNNSSVFGGIDTNKTPILGFRNKFGGGV